MVVFQNLLGTLLCRCSGSVPMARPGEIIVLKGGRGKHRKCNKQRALVMEVPHQEPWMTVKLLGSNKELSWDKRGVAEIKHDPFAMLSDDICLNIFEFLFEKPKTKAEKPKAKVGEITGIEELNKVGRLHAQLRSVSPIWKSTFDSIPWEKYVGLADIWFDYLLVEDESDARLRMRRTKEWLCRHKIRVRTLAVLYFIKPPLLLEMIDDLQTQDAVLVTIVELQGERLVPDPQVPVAFKKSLHDAIARNCPRLEHLIVDLYLPKTSPVYTDYISDALFSLASLRYLFITVGFREGDGPVDPKWNSDTPIEGRVFTNLIKDLPNLRRLHLAGCRSDVFNQRRFHVESKSLKILKIDNVCLSFDCPQLKEIRCVGGPERYGIMRAISRENFDVAVAVAQQQPADETWLGLRLDHPAVASPSFRGKEGCNILWQNFHLWGQGADNYEKYCKRRTELMAATFQTFD